MRVPPDGKPSLIFRPVNQKSRSDSTECRQNHPIRPENEKLRTHQCVNAQPRLVGSEERPNNPIVNLIDAVCRHPAIQSLCERLEGSNAPVAAIGLWGSAAPAATAAIARITRRPLLLVTPHIDQADHACDDIETLLDIRVSTLPAWESLPGESGNDTETADARNHLCAELAAGTLADADSPTIFVAPIQALVQPVPTTAALTSNAIEFRVGKEVELDSIARWLVDRGFERLDQVEQAGDFAIRGGIIDIFHSTDIDPLRVELFGDEIESIRRFEVGTQRSLRTVESAQITHVSDEVAIDPTQTTNFASYLPDDCIVVLHEPVEAAEVAKTILERLDHPVGHFPFDAVIRNLARFSQVHLGRFALATVPDAEAFSVSTQPPPKFDPKPRDAVQQLLRLASDQPVAVLCDNAGERERLNELIVEVAGSTPLPPGVTDKLHVGIGVLHEGFKWLSDRESFLAVAHHEVFHRHLQRRRLRPVVSGRAIDSFLDLKEGDYVVHVLHGIAKFGGLRTMKKRGARFGEEFLTLIFAESATMHVPVAQIDLVQKYIGAKGTKPPLSKLGGTRWLKTKEKVEENVTDLASDLLRVQAERAGSEGIAFPPDTNWQREFESAFPYTPTPDQADASAAIKNDQQQARPMDRLICGDVGFGKTELAIRAAFKVIEYGRQVAVLVPTTVLAEQHLRTFRERMAEYPFQVGCLNRFRSTAEQKVIIEETRKGRIDILIGTHRILSKDIDFADLGLVIVDEEQRFGVEHKERLKRLRSTVDVLTLTATPIPRTLHMSMIGLRDISSLATPPMDRRAITTRVAGWDPDMIKEALVRELNRDGQAYFVHNRVRTIQSIADRIQMLVPDARIVVGHGQMSGDELESVMSKFIRHEVDILVSTTIIEAGLDIPNANTIFIDRADRFGLADLHQLRGRVGRYKHRAYCYLLLDANRSLTESGARRLKAVEQCSELGAGFRIAMRDLEIRGAGNILGPEQSGQIAAVGYDMYCQILEGTVKRMRGDKVENRSSAHLELDVEAYIPRGYIESDRQRMDCYRRMATCRTPEDVEQLEKDLRDTFGPPPASAQTLLTLAEIRVRAGQYGIKTIMRKEPDLIFQFDGEIKKLEALFANASGRASLPDPNTLHWRLPEHYFFGDSLLPILRNLFRREDTKLESPEEKRAANAPPQTNATTRAAASESASNKSTGKKQQGPIRATPNARPADAPTKRRRKKTKR